MKPMCFALAVVFYLCGCASQPNAQQGQPTLSVERNGQVAVEAIPAATVASPVPAVVAAAPPVEAPEVVGAGAVAFGAPPPTPPKNCKDCIPITLRFATDRAKIDSPDGILRLGTDRGDLTYGTCVVWAEAGIHYPKVSIRTELLRVIGKAPGDRMVLGDARELTEERFFDYIKYDLIKERGDSTARRTFIYVHGYANSYKEVAMRTAILANRLGWNGPKVFYTWPSMGSALPVQNYTEDEQNAEWTGPDFASFLETYLSKSGDKQIYLMAHSMGSRVLSHGLVTVAQRNPELLKNVKEIFLFAADMDADVFREQIFSVLRPLHVKVVIYGSSEDFAIKVSRRVHGNDRLGQGPTARTVFAGENPTNPTYIDASSLMISHPLFGEVAHAYIVDSATVLEDVYDRIHGKNDTFSSLVSLDDLNQEKKSRPGERNLPLGPYWVLRHIDGAESMLWADAATSGP